jgi:hypothetical protein
VVGVNESWLPIREKPTYLVSNLGRIKSPRGRILRPGTNGKYGYQFVNLGAGLGRYVHRLVADAFIAPVSGMDVDHADGDTSNNVVANLRVVTHAENMRLQRDRKPACKRGHLFSEHGAWASTGRRYCRTCRQAWERNRKRDRRKAAA